MYTQDELRALHILKRGYNTFVTGGAGVGKSYVIEDFIKWLNENNKSVMITAPTGIAAGHIGGVTLHRALEIPIGTIVKDDLHSIDVADTKSDDLLYYSDVLIIDEISTCRMDIFTYIALKVLKANGRRKRAGKKPIQFVVVGDLFQLPPVITEMARIVLNKEYGDGEDIGLALPFQSKYWKYFEFKPAILTEVVRQNDKEFIEKLNALRVGNKAYIDDLYKMSSPIKNDGIVICGTNKEAAEKNREGLDSIPGRSYSCQAVYDGLASADDNVTDDTIEIKIGARVMTTTNDKKQRYVNGSFGTIIGFDSTGVVVQFDSGITATVEPFDWEIYNYTLTDDNSVNENGDIRKKYTREVVGNVRQYPIKLAYAITIHKSQGQTYDKANISPYCWECGQLYVAISRVKNIGNLHFNYKPYTRDIAVSLNVIKFYNDLIAASRETSYDIFDETEGTVKEENRPSNESNENTGNIGLDFNKTDEEIIANGNELLKALGLRN